MTREIAFIPDAGGPDTPPAAVSGPKGDPGDGTITVTIDSVTPALVAGESSSATPVVGGEAPPRALVSVWIDGVEAGSVFAGDDGRWSYQLPAQPDGPIVIVPRAIPAGSALGMTIATGAPVTIGALDFDDPDNSALLALFVE